jgi:hypothetical protein
MDPMQARLSYKLKNGMLGDEATAWRCELAIFAKARASLF